MSRNVFDETVQVIYFSLAFLKNDSGISTCQFEGRTYGELDVFDWGVDGCAKCICVDSQVNCNKSKCRIGPNEEVPKTTAQTNHHSQFHSDQNDLETNKLNGMNHAEFSRITYDTGSDEQLNSRSRFYLHQLKQTKYLKRKWSFELCESRKRNRNKANLFMIKAKSVLDLSRLSIVNKSNVQSVFRSLVH